MAVLWRPAPWLVLSPVVPRFFLAAVLGALTSSAIAFADPPSSASSASGATRLQRSDVEESLAQEALQAYGWEEEPDPEGKRIEAIEVYVAEVFDERDPVPNFVNIFHVKTRDPIVRQEVLQQVGDKWEAGRITETERNLRKIRQHSVANVVAARGSQPNTIRLLIVVKDVWSLRLNSDWEQGTSGLDYLILSPSEENLAGLRVALKGNFILQRDRYYVGGGLSYPRIGGSRYSVAIGGGLFRERFTGAPEGSYGSFEFKLPQYSRLSKWAYGAEASWQFSKAREYRRGEIATNTVELPDGTTELVPRIYHTDDIEADYWGLRSWGLLHKLDLEFRIFIDHRRYRLPLENRNSPAALEVFEEQYLPVSDRRISPLINLSVYETRFLRTFNIETLGLQEDIRLGYGISTSLFAGSSALGSTRNFVGTNVKMSYTLPLGTGLLHAGVRNRILVGDKNRHEGYFSARTRVVSPSLDFARLHFDSYVGLRYMDYLNVSPFYLGGTNRLRGHPAGSLAGKNIFVSNLELRTFSINILSAEVGLAAFYDVGDTAYEGEPFVLRQGLGAGVRVLFPQAERTVMRLDWGFPLGNGLDPWPGTYVFTFGQAFPFPTPRGADDVFPD